MAYYNQNPPMVGVPPPAPTGYPQPGYYQAPPPQQAPPQVFVNQTQPAPSNAAAEAGCMACLAGMCCCCCLEEFCCL